MWSPGDSPLLDVDAQVPAHELLTAARAMPRPRAVAPVSVRGLAQETGLRPTTVHRYLNGTTDPSFSDLCRLLAALDLRLDLQLRSVHTVERLHGLRRPDPPGGDGQGPRWVDARLLLDPLADLIARLASPRALLSDAYQLSGKVEVHRTLLHIVLHYPDGARAAHQALTETLRDTWVHYGSPRIHTKRSGRLPIEALRVNALRWDRVHDGIEETRSYLSQSIELLMDGEHHYFAAQAEDLLRSVATFTEALEAAEPTLGDPDPPSQVGRPLRKLAPTDK